MFKCIVTIHTGQGHPAGPLWEDEKTREPYFDLETRIQEGEDQRAFETRHDAEKLRVLLNHSVTHSCRAMSEQRVFPPPHCRNRREFLSPSATLPAYPGCSLYVFVSTVPCWERAVRRRESGEWSKSRIALTEISASPCNKALSLSKRLDWWKTWSRAWRFLLDTWTDQGLHRVGGVPGSLYSL